MVHRSYKMLPISSRIFPYVREVTVELCARSLCLAQRPKDKWAPVCTLRIPTSHRIVRTNEKCRTELFHIFDPCCWTYPAQRAFHTSVLKVLHQTGGVKLVSVVAGCAVEEVRRQVRQAYGTGSLYLRYTNQGQVWENPMHVCLSLVGIALFFCFGATEA